MCEGREGAGRGGERGRGGGGEERGDEGRDSRSPIHIFPPHSLITPSILG